MGSKESKDQRIFDVIQSNDITMVFFVKMTSTLSPPLRFSCSAMCAGMVTRYRKQVVPLQVLDLCFCTIMVSLVLTFLMGESHAVHSRRSLTCFQKNACVALNPHQYKSGKKIRWVLYTLDTSCMESDLIRMTCKNLVSTYQTNFSCIRLFQYNIIIILEVPA